MKQQLLRQMTRFKFEWDQWARPSQLPPPEFVRGEKQTWLLLSGRGGGKTRASAELVRKWINVDKFSRVNLIGPTHDDVRDIMVEGESGILAICPRSERPRFVPSRHLLEWQTGATSLLFSADEPERLRGKQHEKFWGDEPASWRNPETLDQAYFGLRLGSCPQAILSTTPKPTKLIKNLLTDPTVIVTRGSSYENRANLAPAFLNKIVAKYEGTRLGRQELLAQILEDREGALFTQALIDAARVDKAPELIRVVIGVDPAVTANEDSDETGVIGAGMDDRRPAHYYVLLDDSLQATPEKWARKVVSAYHRHGADRVVAEVNQGGDLVEATIRNVDPNIPYRAVRATRGKALRAEPISALYEQGRVHHVGIFGELEDEMCDYVPGASASPDRMDALVWALTDLSEHGGYEHSGLIQLWGQQANKSVESTPGRSIVDLGRAQIESSHSGGGKMFGANKSNVMVTNRVRDPRGNRGPDACPECGNRGLARYDELAKCVCGWDSKTAAVAMPPEAKPKPEMKPPTPVGEFSRARFGL